MRAWFSTTFAEPTAAQAQGWPAIAAGEHTLILAPTGSGKTLAAFLWGLDRLVTQPPPPDKAAAHPAALPLAAAGPGRRRREEPAGPAHGHRPGRRAARASTSTPPTVGMRTGDTPADERRKLVRNPPDLLITTPESLYLMLTSVGPRHLARRRGGDRRRDPRPGPHQAGRAPGPHPRAARGALRASAPAHRPVGHPAPARRDRPLPRRLSSSEPADGRPAPRPVTIVDAGVRKPLEIEVVVPVEDMGALGELVDEAGDGPAAAAPARRSIWPSIHPRLLELVQQHRSTLIFVNARRLAERLATRLNELAARGREPRRRGRGPAARAGARGGQGPPRLAVARAAPADRGRAQAGRAQGPGGHQLARARHRHGRGRPGHPGRVARRGVARAAAHRPGRPPGGRAQPRQAVPQAPQRPGRGGGGGAAHARRASSSTPATRATRSTCWPSRSWPCAPSTSGRSTSWPRWCAGPRPTPSSATRC